MSSTNVQRHANAKAALLLRLRDKRLVRLPKWLENKWTAQKILATVPCSDLHEIRRVYALARSATEFLGEKHNVDHIVPLRHPRVCGLHVHWNLRVVPEKVNMSRGNDWCPEQVEIEFDPQLRLI